MKNLVLDSQRQYVFNKKYQNRNNMPETLLPKTKILLPWEEKIQNEK